MDTKLKKSTAFHPQTDGQTEVVNRTVVQLLKGYCSKHPKLWDEQLQYIQHAYNHATHSSTKNLLLKLVLVICQKHRWISLLAKMQWMDIMMQIKQ